MICRTAATSPTVAAGKVATAALKGLRFIDPRSCQLEQRPVRQHDHVLTRQMTQYGSWLVAKPETVSSRASIPNRRAGACTGQGDESRQPMHCALVRSGRAGTRTPENHECPGQSTWALLVEVLASYSHSTQPATCDFVERWLSPALRVPPDRARSVRRARTTALST